MRLHGVVLSEEKAGQLYRFTFYWKQDKNATVEHFNKLSPNFHGWGERRRENFVQNCGSPEAAGCETGVQNAKPRRSLRN
jgi:hypothetical protein